MPWIVDDSCYGNMGISLSGCITEKEIIKAWIIGLSLQSNGSPQKQELSDDDNGSAECSIITIEMRREGTEIPNPILGYYGVCDFTPRAQYSNAVLTTGMSLVMRTVPTKKLPRFGNSWLIKNAVWLFAASVFVTDGPAVVPLVSRS